MSNNQYLLLLAKGNLMPLREKFYDNGGFYNGLGYAFSAKNEEFLQQIVAAMPEARIVKMPLTDGQNFDSLRQSHKVSYFRDKLFELDNRLLSIKEAQDLEEFSEEAINAANILDRQKASLIEMLREKESLKKAMEWAEGLEKALSLDKTKEDVFQIKPYTVSDLRSDLSKIQEGLKTGYPSIDEILQIPQEAVTIIAGRPSHGKTTALLNFFVNMVKLYPEKEFYFFSYEETRSQILLKILNILSQDVISESSNISNLEGYLRGNYNSRSKITEASELLQKLTESSRLIVVDYPFYVEDLSRVISGLKAQGRNIGAIFIDYVQKIKIKQKLSTRQLELQKISEAVLESAKFNSLPIILGAQFGRATTKKEVLRLDNLREAGDIENDAKLVLGIWNEAKELSDTKDETLKSRKVDLEFSVLKNRNGSSNQSIILEFDRPLCTLNEKTKDEMGKLKRKDWDL